MSRKQRGFLLYLDNYELIEDLPNEEKGKWIDAIFLYKREGVVIDFPKGSLLKTAFKVAKSQLDRDSEAWNETCQKRADAGQKGGMAKASNAKQKLAKASNAKQCLANLADNDNDNDIDNVSVIDTDTDIVNKTETEQADADSDALHASAAAECAEPAAELFSVKQIMTIVNKNKVNLTKEGVQEFYNQMQDEGWTLYNKPVEKKMILRTLREYSKRHPEYAKDIEAEEDPDQEQQKKDEEIRLEERRRQKEENEKALEHLMNDPEAVEQWLREIGVVKDE